MILRRAARGLQSSPGIVSAVSRQSAIIPCARRLTFDVNSCAVTWKKPLHITQRFSTVAVQYAAAGQHASEPVDLTPAQYHQLSDTYIDSLVESLEELAEDDEAIDVEYHSGVLNLVFPPAGTYVINKQPPNRQIWLSSPISGPKRYDYVVEDGGKGDWIYLRDGSTLTGLLNEELKLDFQPPDND